MKKTLVTTLAVLAFATSAYAATPGIQVDSGQFHVGYKNYDLKTDGGILGYMGSVKANEYQATYGLNDKLSFVGNYLASDTLQGNQWTSYGWLSDLRYSATELGVQYRITPNIAVAVGNVQSQFKSSQISDTQNEIYGGIDVAANFTNKLGGYGSYLKSANVSDAKVGVTYDLNNNSYVNVGYRDYQNQNIGLNSKGLGVGINYSL